MPEGLSRATPPTTTRRIALTVNGRPVAADVSPRTHLADFLREDLLLTGTHIGCEHGVCGACTLLIDGQPARSCITFAAACDGAAVTTLEGLEDDPVVARLRTAFSANHALQCGYCTPGMLATARDIVTRLPTADEPRIREELSGNLCRCTGYAGIVAAIAEVLAEGAPATAASPPPAIIATIAGPVLPKAATKPATAAGRSGSAEPAGTTVDSDGRTTLTRSTSVAADPAAVWSVLRDPVRVAECLPGASLDGPPEGDRVSGRFAVSVGPMRAGFAGTAMLALDDAARRGRVEGQGTDKATRSKADGTVAFSVSDGPNGGAILETSVTYALSGPLAQFSRGAIVAAVADDLLGRFARNLALAAAGGKVERRDSVGGLGLLLSALWARLRQIMGF